MTPADFRAWHEAMGYTYDTGAAALGVSRGTYADWLAGRSRTTGKPIQISRLVALACAALSCVVCDAPGPSEVHEIKQGQWFTSCALCPDCRRGAFNGLHGQKRMWAVKKMDELDALAATVAQVLN